MSKCINLRTAFPTCRITHDPAFEDKKDPWSFQIPCRLGVIYPFDHNTLAVEVDNHPLAVKQLGELVGMDHGTHWQAGDREHTFLVPARMFEQVAAIVHPRRKRVLTEQHKAKLRENAAKARQATLARNL